MGGGQAIVAGVEEIAQHAVEVEIHKPGAVPEQERLVGEASPADLIHYSLSLPVTAAVIGMPKLQYLEEDARAVKSFKPMPMGKMKTLSDELARKNKASLDRFFLHHVDA